ncbi:hypothetical protein [Providencia burhodogranariea]|uniref:Uncharacterized protein n=1 Tax=Providencia burhodogranariea DSM 19968 TaxID=1141662 RepID=K8WP13_9GAMM|nr:hypothetical protein OOA_08697 [Providencia burhodogranariea DSM 19968]
MRADEYIAYCVVRAFKREQDLSLLKALSYVKRWVLQNKQSDEIFQESSVNVFISQLRYHLKIASNARYYLNQQQQVVITRGEPLATLLSVEWDDGSVIFQASMAEQNIVGLQNELSNQSDFQATLQQLEQLASHIEEPNFAAIFKYQAEKLEVKPESNQALCELLFNVACGSWVFGGMGSWNDSAPFLANSVGLSSQYDKLSGALIKHIYHALRFSANHCDQDINV